MPTGKVFCFSGVQPDLIAALLTHGDLWQSRSTRPPPEVDELVLEPDAACSDNSIDMPDEAEKSQEMIYVDIDTFLASF